MEIFILVAVLGVFTLIAAGAIIGPPKPKDMQFETMLQRIYTESLWIIKYNNLNYDAREGAGIKKQYQGKKNLHR